LKKINFSSKEEFLASDFNGMLLKIDRANWLSVKNRKEIGEILEGALLDLMFTLTKLLH
jgi:hypothetical protein